MRNLIHWINDPTPINPLLFLAGILGLMAILLLAQVFLLPLLAGRNLIPEDEAEPDD